MNPNHRSARRLRAAWMLSLAATIAACSGTPPPPASVHLPEGTPDTWAAANAARDAAIEREWWRMFGDRQLDARVETALLHNRNLQAAAARVLAANEQAILAGAPGLPQVDAGLDATRSRRVFVGFPFGTGGGVPNNTATILNANITVRWELDVWSRLASAEAAALADAQAAAADLAAAQTSLIAQVCKAHFALVEAEAQTREYVDYSCVHCVQIVSNRTAREVDLPVAGDVPKYGELSAKCTPGIPTGQRPIGE